MKGEFGLFLLRVVLGVTFCLHGVDKFQKGIPAIIERFSGIGLPYPQYLTIAVIALEILGGAALVIGLSTRFISFLFICLMIGAIVTVKYPLGFLHGYEIDVVLMAMAATLLFTGSRFIAVDNLFAENNRKR